MAKQIFRLRGVPEDEAQDIRDLLTQYHLEFYETPAGNWGISMPALWLVEDEDEPRAKELISDYQEQRAKTAREEYEQLKREGKHPTLLKKLKENPLQFLFYLAGIMAVIYLSTMPFVDKL